MKTLESNGPFEDNGKFQTLLSLFLSAATSAADFGSLARLPELYVIKTDFRGVKAVKVSVSASGGNPCCRIEKLRKFFVLVLPGPNFWFERAS